MLHLFPLNLPWTTWKAGIGYLWGGTFIQGHKQNLDIQQNVSVGCHIAWCCTTRNEHKHVKIMSFPVPWNMKTMEVFNVWEKNRKWRVGIWKGNAICSCIHFTFFNRVYFCVFALVKAKIYLSPLIVSLYKMQELSYKSSCCHRISTFSSKWLTFLFPCI